MTQSKWEKVRSSPVDISQIDTGEHSLLADWIRELVHPTTINGIRLANYAKSYNNFRSSPNFAVNSHLSGPSS